MQIKKYGLNKPSSSINVMLADVSADLMSAE